MSCFPDSSLSQRLNIADFFSGETRGASRNGGICDDQPERADGEHLPGGKNTFQKSKQ